MHAYMHTYTETFFHATCAWTWHRTPFCPFFTVRLTAELSTDGLQSDDSCTPKMCYLRLSLSLSLSLALPLSYVYIYTHIHTYIRTYIHMYIYTYIHLYICISIHQYICTYIHRHIYTYVIHLIFYQEGPLRLLLSKAPPAAQGSQAEAQKPGRQGEGWGGGA